MTRSISAVAGAACLFATFAAHAASPASGTLTAANTSANPLVFTAGPFTASNNTTPLYNTTLQCDANDPCDMYALTIDLPDGYADANPDTYIQLTYTRDIASDTLQQLVLTDQGSLPDGPIILGYAAATSDTVNTGYLIPSGGKRSVIVETVPTNASGSKLSVSIALVKIARDPGNPNLPYAAQGNGPRFSLYKPNAFPGLGLQASEPSIGINPVTGSVFYNNTLDILRVKFDDSTEPAGTTWESKPGTLSAQATLDPILAVDAGNGRVFNLQLGGAMSLAEYSDNDGETWSPGGQGFPSSGVDHQSIGAGPYPASTTVPILHPTYTNAIYYCSQGIADAYCSRSDDGGLTFNPSTVLYAANDCVGLHGHVKVAPDGTVYVPNKGCGLGTTSVLGNGVPAAAISKDAGQTWSISLVSMAPSGLSAKGDPSIGIGKDNTAYFAYSPLDGTLRVAVSKDDGGSWINDVDVGAIAGIHYSLFPAAVAGDAGRAAVAFVGSTFPAVANSETLDFPGVWNFYIATTYDYGAHWYVSNVAPADLIQGPGGNGNAGSDRNLYDFNDLAMDTEGRIVASVADGCVGACSASTQGHLTELAVIARQTGGPRLMSKYDPTEPVAPAPARVTGYRTKNFVVLNYAADTGGSAVTGYDIYRSTGNGETLLATGYTATTYVDSTATDTSMTYSYRVAARNALGAGQEGNTFAPKVDENAPVTAATCTLPGMTYADQVGEPGAEPSTRDIQSFSVAEPSSQPGKLVFTITPVTAAPPTQAGATFIALFDDPHNNGRRYRLAIDATGATAGYYDGRWYESADEGTPTLFLVTTGAPTLDSGAFDSTTGAAVFTLDKAAWGLNTGDVLRNVHASTAPAAQGTTEVFTHEDAGYDLSYPIVGNDFCAKGASIAPPTVSGATTGGTTTGGTTTGGTTGTTTGTLLPGGPTSPTQTSNGRLGGGAIPLGLLALLGGAWLRRRRIGASR